jgi:hypothetical protein
LRKLPVFVALLPGLAHAADPSMTDLVMPGARVAIGIDVGKILASPIGQAMKSRIAAEMAKPRPDWPPQMAALAGFDWSRYVKEVLIASPGGPGKNPPFLMIVRGSLDRALIESLKPLTGPTADYQGVSLLSPGGKGKATIAFLDESTAVFGQLADVQAAIRRHAARAAPPAALAAQLNRFRGRYDAWIVSLGPLPAPAEMPPAVGKAAFLQGVESFHGGVRFSPDFELSAEIVARSVKEAAGLADGLRWLYSAVQAQARNSGKAANRLENMTFTVVGRRISIGLHVPAETLRAALQQTRRSPETPSPAAPAASPVGQPPPPGTIRIESSPSDMGTVLLPTEKPR